MIDAKTAYRYNDNYQINDTNNNCVGVEHNKTEADAIAKYLTNYHGVKYTVKWNRADQVREARSIRKDCVRVAQREMILDIMGIYK